MGERKSIVDLRGLSEEVIEKAEEAVEVGYGRFDARWSKWSRAFNLGLQAASSMEPRASSIFTLWVLISQCIEARFVGDECSPDTVEAVRQRLRDVEASDLAPRIERLFG